MDQITFNNRTYTAEEYSVTILKEIQKLIKSGIDPTDVIYPWIKLVEVSRIRYRYLRESANQDIRANDYRSKPQANVGHNTLFMTEHIDYKTNFEVK